MRKQCPSCKFVIFDLDMAVLMGKTLDYWIDLQVAAEVEGTVKFIEEIVLLKSKLYDAEEKLKIIDDITK